MRDRWTLTALALALTLALAAAASGAWLAGRHPLLPSVLLIGLAVWTLAVAVWPRLWLLLVPAALPLLNFLPWSGWLGFEEFDLLILGVVAGGYARLAVLGTLVRGRGARDAAVAPLAPLRPRAWVGAGLLLCLAVSGGWALWRGLADAGGWSFGGSDGYTEALNSVRVFKSLGFALLVAPLIHDVMRREAERAIHLVAWGVLAGLAMVCLAVLWERQAFPGLVNFSSRYRTTALFWEMHVGGAAIDAYLAMCLPFVAWALVVIRRPAAWVLMALLAVAAVYALLTTFSRGAILAGALSLAGWASLTCLPSGRGRGSANSGSATRRPAIGDWTNQPAWKRVGSAVLGIILLTEAAAVSLAGGHMGERINVADRDFAQRLAHWRNGLALLSTPADWLLGIGLGRLPAHYARQVGGGEFSGAVAWRPEPASTAPEGRAGVRGFARLAGPLTNPSLAGWYGLARRVELLPGGMYRVGLDLRTDAATELAVRVCEQHLLFPANCQTTQLRVGATAGAWRHHSATLVGPALDPGSWFAPRLGLLTLSVPQAGRAIDLARINLRGPTQTEFATVGDFSEGLTHWFALARVHFLPWHIDNLYLELLIERGWLGVLLMVATLAAGLRAAARRASQGSVLAGALTAGLAGGLLVGVWGSIMDTPRVAFLLFLLTSCALAWRRGPNSH